ncbi:hypothetical protein [Streptomyces sp. NRRL S-1022]|uniref:hypothetical protein n=1 Tax=Streptomyces sp. NRRL S-1022 TaxID=1463880 RepID=UPI00068F6515|nr:hypothetical protein [Streptomyces sp. NRRL S-1022]
MAWLYALATLAVGYLLGRARLGHRLSDWANWQKYGKPTGWRYAVMFTVLSAENLGWLVAHPVQGWHAWQHRNDPPPPRSPAPQYDPDWAAKRRARP